LRKGLEGLKDLRKVGVQGFVKRLYHNQMVGLRIFKNHTSKQYALFGVHSVSN